MYYMLNDSELKKIEQVSEMTLTDYEVTGKFVPVSSLMNVIEDLLVELHKEQEKITDLENDINNYYEIKNVNEYEEYGVSEKDFI